jgi:RES domain-containing protein
MIVYRVANLKHKDATLSGIGAEKVGGRWNEIGTRAVYCSENVSLALLEYYVHSKDISTLPQKIVVAKIQIPDEFIIEELAELPLWWNHFPYSFDTTQLFSTKVKNRDFFAIKVPSTIVPLEFNYVLNPLFKDFGRVEIVEFLDLPIDERLKTSKH